MKGRAIGEYLPVLLDALQFDPGPEGLRTAAQAQGRRWTMQIFLANAWFSSYMAEEGKRLAAIVVDSSEEMRDRGEEESLLIICRKAIGSRSRPCFMRCEIFPGPSPRFRRT